MKIEVLKSLVYRRKYTRTSSATEFTRHNAQHHTIWAKQHNCMNLASNIFCPKYLRSNAFNDVDYSLSLSANATLRKQQFSENRNYSFCTNVRILRRETGPIPTTNFSNWIILKVQRCRANLLSKFLNTYHANMEKKTKTRKWLEVYLYCKVERGLNIKTVHEKTDMDKK